MRNGVFDFRACAFANISANIDYKNAVRHIDFALVHIVEHFFRLGEGPLIHVFPDFIVAGMTK